MERYSFSTRSTNTLSIYLSAFLGGISPKDVELITRFLRWVASPLTSLVRRAYLVHQEYVILARLCDERRTYALSYSPHSGLSTTLEAIPSPSVNEGSGMPAAGRHDVGSMGNESYAVRSVTHPALEGTPYPALIVDVCEPAAAAEQAAPAVWIHEDGAAPVEDQELEVIPTSLTEPTLCIPDDPDLLNWNELRRLAVALGVSAKGKRVEVLNRVRHALRNRKSA